MSTDEMREYCERIHPYGLKIRVRLKSRADLIVGKIVRVENERFEMATEDDTEERLNFAWVASITNA